MGHSFTRRIKGAWGFVRDRKRLWPTAALLAGFIWDAVTLGRPDQLFDNVVLLFYLLLAGAGILLLNFHQERSLESPPLWQLLLIQFSFGNLSSALFILYGKSGTFAGNWIFFLLLAALILGNEFFHGRFRRLRFHIAMYYLMLFAYAVLIVPIALRKVGDDIFIISGIVSLIAIGGYLLLVRAVAPVRVHRNRKPIALLVLSVFVSFNALYFLNFIPPVPLSLRDIGIYHSVVRQEEGNYQVSYEAGAWYEPWKRSDNTLHYGGGERAYCFSSVFAPARISTPIYHRWEKYDEESGKWITNSLVSFLLTGGRPEGFRGFSEKVSLQEGRWRCSVETQNGVLVGRRAFEVARGAGRDLEFDIR
jgi:hypothetical protein